LGTIPNTIGDIIGEVIGVVRDGEFAIGIQALNVKTLGGYPTRENDIENDYGADDPGHYANLPPELKQGRPFAATRPGALSLAAFCRRSAVTAAPTALSKTGATKNIWRPLTMTGA